VSLRFLLDTNVLSEPTRPIPNTNVVKMLERYKEEVTTATVVFHELLFGVSDCLNQGNVEF
jgi:tRNA(fMet)-specific endonuclease VapC